MKSILITFIILLALVGVFVLNKDEVQEDSLVDTPVTTSEPTSSNQNCGLHTIPTSGNSMVDHGIPEDTRELTINTCQWCEEGDICAFICKSEKCFSEKLRAQGETSDGRIGYNKFLKHREGDCYWFEGDGDKVINGVNYISTDSRQYGWLCGNELEIAGKVILPTE